MMKSPAAASATVFLLLAACTAAAPPAPPQPVSASLGNRLAPALATLDSAIRAGAAPGAVLAVSAGGERFIYGTGRLGQDDAARPGPTTLYDMASLTKVVALTTVAMMAVEEGKLDLDAPVVRYLPEFTQGRGNKGSVTIRDLLLHDSGLPAHRALWTQSRGRSGAIRVALISDLDTPPGTRMVYSDLGAITLATVIERLYGKRIDHLFMERVAKPLGLQRTVFLPPQSWLTDIAPTELDPWRGRMLRGEVHDENAGRLKGASGHAGLFSDAEGALTFGEWALAGAKGQPWRGALQPPAAFASWTVRQDRPAGSSRALGWDTPSGVSSAGTLMSARSFGHTGFTGTSLWVDPTRDVVVVLLTNRVHPTRNTPQFGLIRSVVTDAVMRSLFGPIPPRPRPERN